MDCIYLSIYLSISNRMPPPQAPSSHAAHELYYPLARGENLPRCRRGVARHALRGLEPAEGELALRPGMRGAVGVHGLVEPSVGVGEGDELQSAECLTAHGLADKARLRVHVLARHGLR